MQRDDEAHRRTRVTVIVHVIEARHLVSKDSNHLSDPFVRVNVAGRRQSTEIRRNQVNATWNQVFMFEDLDLTLEEYNSELIVLQVFDANVILRNELIGQFSFGLSKVRDQPAPYQHQVYRRWMVLTEPSHPLEEQGYLLATVTVLAAGDVPPAHERQDDFRADASEPGGPGEDRVLRMPEVRRRGYNVTVKVFRGEHLLPTDAWGKTSDPFVVVRFNGAVARTPHQSHTLTPNWNHLLTIPVYTPCFSDVIELQLYDYVRGQPDRLLGTHRLRFTSLLGESFPPGWFNFYGRVADEVKASGWICDVVRAASGDIDGTAYVGRVLMSLNTTLTDMPAAADRPCAPIKGPKTTKYALWVDVFRGSELPLSFLGGSVQVEVQFGPAENRRVSDFCSTASRFLAASKDALESDVFANEANSVRFTASGDNLAPEALRGKGAQSMGLVDGASCGPCQFRAIELDLPLVASGRDSAAALAQLYDIVINVYVKGLVGGAVRVGFIRIKPTDVWGFNNPPEWHPIRGLVNRKGESATPGQLLVAASFGPLDLAKETGARREAMAARASARYQLRAYVYGARNLSATSKSGLASAHVRVTLGGKTARLEQSSNEEALRALAKAREQVLGALRRDGAGAGSSKLAADGAALAAAWEAAAGEDLRRSSVSRDTLNPLWYETLVIDDVTLPSPLSLSPDVEIRVCDETNLSSGDYVGRVKFPAALCALDVWPVGKRPRWLRVAKSDLTDLRKHNPSAASSLASGALLLRNAKAALDSVHRLNQAGEVLVKLELVPVQELLRYPMWAHQWPRVIPCALHLGCVGLRQLEEYGLFGSIDKPYVRVSAQSVPNMEAPVCIAARAAQGQEQSLVAQGVTQGGAAAVAAAAADAAATGKDLKGKGGADDGLLGDINDKAVAKHHEWASVPPPFADEMKRGRLSQRWLNAAQQVEQLLQTTLRRYLEAGKLATLFHPEGCAGGVAAWQNRARSADDKDKQEEAARTANSAATLPGVEPGRVDSRMQMQMQQLPSDREEEDLESGALENDIELVMPGSELLRKERARRTFFDRETIIVNMPVDPFYAPSLTIQVLDERFFGDDVIATATINTRDLTELLYTDAMRLRATRNEEAYEIPRFAMSGDTRDELARRAAEDSDDEDTAWSAMDAAEDAVADEQASPDGDLYDDAGEDAGGENEENNLNLGNGNGRSTNAAAAAAAASPGAKPGRKQAAAAAGTSASAAASPPAATPHSALLDEKAFDQPAEGHYALPTAVGIDVEEMNATVTDDVLETVAGADDSAYAGAYKEAGGGITWPAQDTLTMEANARTNRLEELEEMQPAPFRSVALWRGTSEAGDRKQAGVFKAVLVLRPHDEDLPLLMRAVENARPARDRRGKVLQTRNFVGSTGEEAAGSGGRVYPFVALQVGDLVRVVDREAPSRGGNAAATATAAASSRLQWRLGADANALEAPEEATGAVLLVEKLLYRPDRRSRVLDRGLVGEAALANLRDPLGSLEVSPDVLKAADGGTPKIPPIVEMLAAAQRVKIRVYVVACSQLTARSLFQNRSDPYLVVKLNVPPYIKDQYSGVTEHNDRANYKSNTLDPFFGAFFELDATFPDVAELEVQVWNANYLSDDLIGSTRIDLEDRWFNPNWHQLKYQRAKIKEYRPLRAPGSELSQGIAELWVEMYRPEDAVHAPIIDIRMPAAQEWELRVVIWETRRVPLFEDHNYANLYITGEIYYEGLDGKVDEEQYFETDSHTGLKDGKGIFNFRMKFSLQAPSKYPRLKLKVWERWLLSHTALGEATVDLSDLVRVCSTTGEDVVDRARRWLPMTHPDWPGQKRGDLDIQMSCVTRRHAEAHPVGIAREAPNENPFLPDPPRESLFSQVFRSVGYGRSICCVVCCIIVILVILLALFLKP